jgi:predicted enzyme related to lactoylglutathione lyase
MTEAASPRRLLRGTPCWTSLMVHDLAATRRFYHELFGWEYHAGPEQLAPYARAVLDGRAVAGLGGMPRRRRLTIAWLPYMAADDADVATALVRDYGGTVAIGPLDAGEAGRVAVVADNLGASFGVWQPGSSPQMPASSPGTAGTPVWYELTTQEAWTVGKFYPSVFGYDAQARVESDLEYITLRLEGRPVAGIHGVGRALPRERGTHWATYFAVEDVEAAVRRVASLGGRVVAEPGEWWHGVRATVADLEGAQFHVVAPPDAMEDPAAATEAGSRDAD